MASIFLSVSLRTVVHCTLTTNISTPDASYRFLYVDIGGCGRYISDGGLFNQSSLA